MFGFVGFCWPSDVVKRKTIPFHFVDIYPPVNGWLEMGHNLLELAERNIWQYSYRDINNITQYWYRDINNITQYSYKDINNITQYSYRDINNITQDLYRDINTPAILKGSSTLQLIYWVTPTGYRNTAGVTQILENNGIFSRLYSGSWRLYLAHEG